ncbi:PKD domain-containing protein [Myroides sp. M-43]|uniref:PKD domain-containing protein n=1 Tax=Myroides oncorhynchi TaxID=2893756 RepID=UPI001E3D75F9|nr:PKD domain-containing protein [Myroides oncorhynchi]MCC9042458.1 PKD domain-containing protein [Myroides oncorhynchi]
MKTTKIRLSLMATLCLSAITFIGCSSDSSSDVKEPEGEGGSISYDYSDVTKVFDFHPAPGQFVNILPKYEEGDTQETMKGKALKAISGKKPDVISLGGFGGYIVMGFAEPINNVKGQRDFSVLGNAFTNSSEPGIILVSFDKNGDGLPNDEWYEIAGSEYKNAKTVRDYEMTFFRPTSEPLGNIKNYIKYKNNQGEEGYKPKNQFHDQSYYPMWIKEDSLVFKGVRLPNNAFINSTSELWELPALGYGYADNHINGEADAAMDIDWAVDSKGNKVKLDKIHFIKIYTSMDQDAGRLGETSTEVMGIIDLHKAKVNIPTR